MKRKRTGAKVIAGKATQKAPVRAEQKSENQWPPGHLTESSDGVLRIRPFPESLLHEAEREPDHVDLAEYWRVIFKLREKGFTFRDIALWLSERNVEADHNAVYRVYSNHMTAEQTAIESDLEEREKQMIEEL
ncbi:MAG: hypothetical protein ABSH38_04965 [Verrucomicrobiota bacterium]|jgi:hypothetical protein